MIIAEFLLRIVRSHNTTDEVVGWKRGSALLWITLQ